ncbi:hypothetical protein GCM10027589_19590 [Actinocorallia lasiicapitis]
MGAHSDQALDLADDSFIALFSCYRTPASAQPRKLVFESKASPAEKFEIPLTDHSVIAFSLKSNRHLKHRIILDKSTHPPENPWLGITYRTSKTHLHFRDGHPHLPTGTLLTPATKPQSDAFYDLRRQENTNPDFHYPPLTYTLSPPDLHPPT